MATMTTQQWHDFVMTGTRTGKLAVTLRDGRPYVTPIWFVLDGDDVVLTTGSTSVKNRVLRRDPRVSLCVDDENPPYSFVVISGEATISEDPDQLLHWATVLGSRYMGAERGAEYGARNGCPASCWSASGRPG